MPKTEKKPLFEETLYEGDGGETMAVCQSKRLTFGWTNFGGRSVAQKRYVSPVGRPLQPAPGCYYKGYITSFMYPNSPSAIGRVSPDARSVGVDDQIGSGVDAAGSQSVPWGDRAEIGELREDIGVFC